MRSHTENKINVKHEHLLTAEDVLQKKAFYQLVMPDIGYVDAYVDASGNALRFSIHCIASIEQLFI